MMSFSSATRLRPLALPLVLAAISAACAGHVNDDVWRPIAERSYATQIGTAIHESDWLFAVIESFHLVGLAILGGAVLIVDFRLLGLGLRDEAVVRLSREAQPVLLGSLAVMLTSGFLLYLSEATKFYSGGFWDSAEFPFIYKMLFLMLALFFTFTIRRKMLASAAASAGTLWPKLVALISIFLWLGVAIGGRGIGFY